MKKLISLLFTILLVMSINPVDAAEIRAEATPLLGPGYIERGVPFTIDVYMNNDDPTVHFGYSMPFTLYSPDASIGTVIHRDVGGYGDFNSIAMLNDYNTYWAILNQWTGISWDGNLADTINHTTASISGWPTGLGEQLVIQFALQINEEGTFCIDSCSVPNQSPPGKFDWLFDYETPFNGPYCWDVVDEIPQDPEIGVSETSFEFNTVAGDPPPAGQLLQITNTANGTLDWTATWNSSWLGVSPAFGVAPSNVQITANTIGLTAGVYTDTILVSDPDATNNPVSIPVVLTIIDPPPTISLSQGYFSFTAVADDANPPDQYLSVDNSGGSVLNWTASNVESWLMISPASGTDFGEITLSVDITGLTFGEYFDTITVTDPGATNDPQKAIVRLEIASSLPVLEVTPSYLYVPIEFNDPVPAPKTFSIENAGAGSMNFYLETTSTFISSISPDSGAAPATVTVTFDSIPGFLGQTFFDTIIVYSLEAINSPQLLEVRYEVVAEPAILIVNTDSVYHELYECAQGAGIYIPPKITVYNGGGGDFAFSVSNSQPWLTPTPDTADAPEQISLNVDYPTMSPGFYYDTLVVSSQSTANASILVPITIQILATDQDPTVSVNTQYFSFKAQENKNGLQRYLIINNVNPGCMTWELQEDVVWITSANTTVGNGYPWNMILQPNGYGATMGSYVDTAYVVADQGTNSPVPLYFDITIWKLYGDVNFDGVINLLDIVYYIAYLYQGGPAPMPETRVGDANCDNLVDLVDIVAVIDYLYNGSGPLCGNPY